MGYVGLIFLCCIAAAHLGLTSAGWTSELCFQSLEVGPCRGYFPRWFYNSTTQRCESFIYGGCEGNQNRFLTIENCENACGCDQCTLQPDTGLCRARIPSYFYNTTSGKCEEFIYGGCGGNENRFETAAECVGNCTGNSTCPIRGQKYEDCPGCQGTCDNPVVPCPLACNGGGCACPSGQLVNTVANKCVHPSQCPINCSDVQCPEVNCAVGDATIPPGSCCPVCVCKDGENEYLPGEPFMIDCNFCSCSSTGLAACTLIFCPTPRPPIRPRCSIEGQEYTECGTACPLTCNAPDPVPCTLQCVQGCQCPNGTVLDEENKRCVPPNLCSFTQCDMCTFQPETGLCEAYIPSYYYNIRTRRCEKFIYGGCGGNFNRYPTLDMCGTKCACENRNCRKGSQCKMYEPTGEAYCEPSCDIDNGGCDANQTCSLRDVTCVRAPCPPVVECTRKCPIEGQVYTNCGTACPEKCGEPPADFCTLQCVQECQCPSGTVLDEAQNKCVTRDQCSSCPPTCSHKFCSKRKNRNKPCSRPPPHSASACPDQCHSTYCNACYYSEENRNSPKKCNNRVCRSQEVTSSHLKRWAKCVDKQDRKNNKCKGDCIAAKNFKCYDYPSCLCG